MDFASLLEQHKKEVSKPPIEERLDNNPEIIKQQKEQVVSGLNSALSASRYDGDNSNHHNGRRRNRRHGSSNAYEQPVLDPDSGHAREIEPGTFKYTKVWGYYELWDAEKWGSPEAGDLLVQFEAKGDDNIVIAMSPNPSQACDMYEIVIGGWKDTKSVIRREAQGPDKALSAQPRLCSSHEFLSYWAMLKNGVVSVGVGATPGQSIILAWKDPEPILAKYISFTTWDRKVFYRNVRVSQCESGMELGDEDMAKFMPEYLIKLEQERQRQKERAERFGSEYQEPSPMQLAASVLTPAEQEQLKKSVSGKATGFVTGFDPTTEEEKKKAEDRAKRFGLEKEEDKMDDADDILSRAKREARAQRFAIPVLEDSEMVNGLVRDLTGLRVPRKDPESEDLPRDEAIHIYGSFDQVYTNDIMEWFGDYGASHIEWLHDCACNVVFVDQVTARRAMVGLAREIPIIEEHKDAVQVMKDKKYFCAPFPLRSNQGLRFFLIRQASVVDVKAAKDTGYRTTIGYNRRRGGRRGRGRGRRVVARAASPHQPQQQEDGDANAESVIGKRTAREDNDDEDEEGNKRSKRMQVEDE